MHILGTYIECDVSYNVYVCTRVQCGNKEGGVGRGGRRRLGSDNRGIKLNVYVVALGNWRHCTLST